MNINLQNKIDHALKLYSLGISYLSEQSLLSGVDDGHAWDAFRYRADLGLLIAEQDATLIQSQQLEQIDVLDQVVIYLYNKVKAVESWDIDCMADLIEYIQEHPNPVADAVAA